MQNCTWFPSLCNNLISFGVKRIPYKILLLFFLLNFREYELIIIYSTLRIVPQVSPYPLWELRPGYTVRENVEEKNVKFSSCVIDPQCFSQHCKKISFLRDIRISLPYNYITLYSTFIYLLNQLKVQKFIGVAVISKKKKLNTLFQTTWINIYAVQQDTQSDFNEEVYSALMLARHVSDLIGPPSGAFCTSCIRRLWYVVIRVLLDTSSRYKVAGVIS